MFQDSNLEFLKKEELWSSLESKNEAVRWRLTDILYELLADDTAEEKD